MNTELQVIPTTKVITINEPSVPAMDMYTVEKAVEFTKLRTTQLLRDELAVVQTQIGGLTHQIAQLSDDLRTDVSRTAIATIRKDKRILSMAKSLSTFFSREITPELLVSSAHLGGSGYEYPLQLLDSKVVNKVKLLISLGMKVQAIAQNAKEAKDADCDDFTSDGRPIIEIEDYVYLSPLNADQLIKFSKLESLIRKHEDAIDARKSITTKLERLAEQTNNIKAQILEHQLNQTTEGKTVMAMVEASINSTMNGNYLSLL